MSYSPNLKLVKTPLDLRAAFFRRIGSKLSIIKDIRITSWKECL